MKSHRFLTIALPLLAGGLPSQGVACAIYESVESKIESGYNEGHIKAVVGVTIISARHVREAQADTHPWRAKAKIDHIYQGKDLPETVQFERGWGSAACEWDLPPLPAKGERWIIYLWKDHHSGQFKPLLPVRFGVARQYDPRLAVAGSQSN